MDTSPDLERLAVSPHGFVFDPYTGATFTVNPTGRVLLEALREGQDLDGLVATLGERFEVGEQDLRRDVVEYVGLLREHGLLPAGFEL